MSTIMKSSDGRRGKALLAIHDVTPRWTREILDILTDLKERSIPAINLAVVPRFHRRDDWRDAPALRTAILKPGRGLRTEVLLHGCYHLRVGENARLPWRRRLRSWLQSASEDEFYGLDPAEAGRRLDLGRKVLGEAFTVRTAGFIPPAWGMSRGLVEACRRGGLSYAEDQVFIYEARTGARVFSPLIAFATRSAVREGLARAWARTVPRLAGTRRLLRLALHPSDYRSPGTRRLALRTIEVLSRDFDWLLYREALSSERRRNERSKEKSLPTSPSSRGSRLTAR